VLPIQQHSQYGGDLWRLPDQLPPGERDELVAEQLQLDIAGPVGLEGGAAAMRLVIELGNGYDAMLARSQPSNRDVRVAVGALPTHVGG
jgi:hypothetical protein